MSISEFIPHPTLSNRPLLSFFSVFFRRLNIIGSCYSSNSDRIIIFSFFRSKTKFWTVVFARLTQTCRSEIFIPFYYFKQQRLLVNGSCCCSNPDISTFIIILLCCIFRKTNKSFRTVALLSGH